MTDPTSPVRAPRTAEQHEDRAAWLLRPDADTGLTVDDIAAAHAHAQLATALRLRDLTAKYRPTR